MKDRLVKVICSNNKCKKVFESKANNGFPEQRFCEGYCRNNARYGVISYGLL